MIEIDGSHGEGGGQILRTAVSLASVLRKSVHVSNIRSGRPSPGLSPQHLTSIEAAAELCDAEVEGLYVGSKEIAFEPGQLTGGDFEFDVGTAGSVSLVLQTCLLPASMSKSVVRIRIRGGTDVRWSPPIEYVAQVHIPLLERFGVSCELDIESRGFYPEGGGTIIATCAPSGGLHAVDLGTRGELKDILGIAFAQNLPEHVVTRMKHSALKSLVNFNRVKVQSQITSGSSTGAGIVLAARYEHSILGESVLGEKGVRAETIGESCAIDLMETIDSGATVDEHGLDQLLPYMALADGRSTVLVEGLTEHAKTNIWVIERFLGRRFVTSEDGGLVRICTV